MRWPDPAASQQRPSKIGVWTGNAGDAELPLENTRFTAMADWGSGQTAVPLCV